MTFHSNNCLIRRKNQWNLRNILHTEVNIVFEPPCYFDVLDSIFCDRLNQLALICIFQLIIKLIDKIIGLGRIFSLQEMDLTNRLSANYFRTSAPSLFLFDISLESNLLFGCNCWFFAACQPTLTMSRLERQKLDSCSSVVGWNFAFWTCSSCSQTLLVWYPCSTFIRHPKFPLFLRGRFQESATLHQWIATSVGFLPHLLDNLR